MNTPLEKIITEALKLPLQARAFVAEKLIESLDSGQTVELSLEWREEIRKRCREIDEGLVKLSDEQAVFERAYSVFE